MRILAIITLFSTIINAQNHYVSHSGTSVPPYSSWETAADSISKAIEVSVDHDTIFIANGIYQENLTIDKELFLIGESSESTIIDGRGLDSLTVQVIADAILENFKIYGQGFKPNPYNAAIFITAEKTKILNCIIDSSYCGIGSTGNIVVSNSSIINCKLGFDLANIEETSLFELENSMIALISQGTAILPGPFGTIIVENCVFTSKKINSFSEVYNSGFNQKKIEFRNNIVISPRAYGLNMTYGVDSLVIENNTFCFQYDDSYRKYGAVYTNKINTPVIRNNIFYNNYRGVVFFDEIHGDYYLDYNLYWGNVYNTVQAVIGTHSLIQEPMFVENPVLYNTEPFDVHLQAFSPGIDSGDPLLLDTDGSRSDIGAFGGPKGESYFYRDLPPDIPTGVNAEYFDSTKSIKLDWSQGTAADIAGYRVYRDTTWNLTSTNEYFVMETVTSSFNDTSIFLGKKYYYVVTSKDSSGNESNASQKVSINVTGMGENSNGVPVNEYRLEQNYPNPFNPKTRIGFRLKERGQVKLSIYSLTGEKIQDLVNREYKDGYHEVDFSGENLSSGLYLYKIEAKDSRNITVYSDIKKMIYLK